MKGSGIMKKVIAMVVILCLVFVFSACNVVKKIEPVSVKLYFLDDNMNLAMETREVTAENTWKAIVEEVVKGPTVTGLSPAVNGEVKVLSAEIVDGVCVVDLSEEFRTYNTGGSLTESLAIYSIVNSLCKNGAENVKINIEGDTEADFGGHFYLGDTFELESNMIRIEDRYI